MIKVAGMWERGWNSPFMEFDLWDMVIREFGVDEFIMTPVTGCDKTVTEYSTLTEVLEANSSLEPVFIDETSPVSLEAFTHPGDAIYIFGRVGVSPLPYSNDNLSLKVETPTNLALMWPHQILPIILRHRWLSA
jgi:hypothetical protein